MPRAMTGRASDVPSRYTFYAGICVRSRWVGVGKDAHLVDAVGLDSRIDQFSDELAFHVLFFVYI